MVWIGTVSTVKKCVAIRSLWLRIELSPHLLALIHMWWPQYFYFSSNMNMVTHCAQECVRSAYKLSFYITCMLTARVTESWQRLVGVDKLAISLKISVCTFTHSCRQENTTSSYGLQFMLTIGRVFFKNKACKQNVGHDTPKVLDVEMQRNNLWQKSLFIFYGSQQFG